MNLSLKGRRAIICGGTQGIGLAIARELAVLGADCTLVARSESSLRQAVASLDLSQEQKHGFAVADFQDNAAVQMAIDGIIKKGPVHILINNTGGPAPGLLHDADSQLLVDAFRQHIINYHHLVQSAIPSMKKAGYGRIVNIVSTSVKVPIPNLGVSNTIRAATAGWAKTLANELGQFGITVNNILPGLTATQRLDSLISNNATRQDISTEEVENRMKQQIPAQRFGKPEEIAAMAAFLCTPAASYVSGANIPVDGGSTGAF